MDKQKEKLACIPHSLISENFNALVQLPYDLTVEHLRLAMQDFINFLGFINQQLSSREIERLESMLMPANFSSIVGEFMVSSIPKYCSTLTKNQYHNGHPDLIPTGHFPKNAVQHADEGIEIKGSRYLRAWQGHNPEDTWLMVFVFDSSRPTDLAKEIEPRPFRFVKVVGARIVKSDWTFAGRSETSRRTITASINESGFQKMQSNWIYQDFDYLKIARIISPENTLPEPLSESDIEVEN
jgi:hypothetical protein